MADMEKLRGLTKGELVHRLASVQDIASETADRWAGQVATHDEECYTRHAACLAAAVVRVIER